MVIVIARVVALYDTVPSVPAVKVVPLTLTARVVKRVETASSKVKVTVSVAVEPTV